MTGLGLLFETRVGAGRLLVWAIDLPALLDKPEARQLLHSLLAYLAGPAFNPAFELERPLLQRLLPRGE